MRHGGRARRLLSYFKGRFLINAGFSSEQRLAFWRYYSSSPRLTPPYNSHALSMLGMAGAWGPCVVRDWCER